MLGAKRRRPSDISSVQVVKMAREVKLDFEKVVPPRVGEWLEVVAKSRNTAPEFLLLSAIPATATLMGPSSSVQVRSTYSEPVNIYGIVLSPPGAGKSQAFDLAVTSPFAVLDNPTPTIVVGDHTKSGLARHLADNNGIALIAGDEFSTFFDNLCSKKKDGMEERAFLNKLYDRRDDMGTYTYEYGNTRLEIPSSRVCISGFSQDEEFVKQFIEMSQRKDGFVDRLLFAVPPPKLLMNEEVDEWSLKLKNFAARDLTEIYQEIWEMHSYATIRCTYMLSELARKEFNTYSDELTRQLNSQFNYSSTEDSHEVSSKDGRTVLRLAGALHVLYSTIEKALTDLSFRQDGYEEQDFNKTISLQTMKYAIALTDYYKSQRNIFVEAAKGNCGTKAMGTSSLKAKILSHPGPCVTVRNLTRAIPSGQRPEPGSTDVLDAMRSLEDDQAGVTVTCSNNVTVFLKRKRSDIESDETASQIFKNLITADYYEEKFHKRDDKLSKSNFKNLLKNHPDEAELINEFNL